jgi:hypothetical protein
MTQMHASQAERGHYRRIASSNKLLEKNEIKRRLYAIKETRYCCVGTVDGVNGRLQHGVGQQGERRRALQQGPGFQAGMEQSGSAV